MTGSGEFRSAYASAFARYVATPGEEALSSAYDLGRSAVRQGLSVLDLASAHHDTLLAQAEAGLDGDLPAVLRAGGEFFQEAVSAFEMVQRVLQEAREEAAVERRQAVVMRQLSSFLGDASIALDASSSLAEMLQLVAEHAREVLEADCCVARLSIDERDRRAEACADGVSSPSLPDLQALYAAVRAPGGAVRMSGAELARHPALPALEPGADHGPPSWLAAPLTALDGRDIGLIELFAAPGREFTELDEAVLVQLAQMASAAVERAQLYRH